MNAKKASQSHTEHVQIVLSQHINGSGRLFGGQLMAWVDVVAAVVARRHSGCQVTTASIEKLDFKHPAKINSTIVIISDIISVGNTSMRVKVDTFKENLDGSRVKLNTAILTLVALDDNGNPTRVPRLLPE